MDGIMCREIAKKFLPGAELIGWNFGDPKIPFPSEGSVYVLDLSPDVFAGGLAISEIVRLTWIDHHISSILKWGDMIPGYRIDGVAACRLAWQWFMRPLSNELPALEDYRDGALNEPLAVELAGRYDIWDHRDPDVEVFHFGLESIKLEDEHWNLLLNDYHSEQAQVLINSLLANGRIIQAYKNAGDAILMKRSYMVVFNGLNLLTLNSALGNSLTFKPKDVPETGHDALCLIYYTGKVFKVSLYHAAHRKDLDLSVIATKYGGGGHKGACGFEMETYPF